MGIVSGPLQPKQDEAVVVAMGAGTPAVLHAALVLASPSRQTHPQRHWRPLSRQVLQMTNLPAVTTGGLGITPGTSSAPLSERTDRPAPITAFRTQQLEAGAERPLGIFHHGPPAHSPSQRSSQTTITRSEEEPLE